MLLDSHIMKIACGVWFIAVICTGFTDSYTPRLIAFLSGVVILAGALDRTYKNFLQGLIKTKLEKLWTIENIAFGVYAPVVGFSAPWWVILSFGIILFITGIMSYNKKVVQEHYELRKSSVRSI